MKTNRDALARPRPSEAESLVDVPPRLHPATRGDLVLQIVMSAERTQRVELAMQLMLNKRQQLALRLHFSQGLNFTKTGESLGVTDERARQIIAKAIGKLRKPLGVFILQSVR